jgi:hypothetical protein
LSYPHILVMIQWGKQNGSAGNFIRLKNKRRRRLFCSACRMGIGMSLYILDGSNCRVLLPITSHSHRPFLTR